MRLITEKICNAFERRQSLKIGNSQTDGDSLWLHTNLIATFIDDELWITNSGWFSNTTKERLNGLTGVSIRQSKGIWYLNEVEWDGSFINPQNMSTNRDFDDVVEFDLTSKWIESKGYSKPIYSVYHTLSKQDAKLKEDALNMANISTKIIENDTVGKYEPNFFIVVQVSDFKKSKKIIAECL